MSYDYSDFVLLANSRKHGEACVAGKSHLEKSWVRPVSDRSGGALPAGKTKKWKLLQHVSIPTQHTVPFLHQTENVLIDNGTWYEQNKFHDYNMIQDLLDTPDSIWCLPGETDPNKVSLQAINHGLVTNSLYFLKIEKLRFRNAWTYDSAKRHPKRHLLASFQYQGMSYEFPVTDPYVEKAFIDKAQGSYLCTSPEIFACVSLGEPFDGYCYKLVASILCTQRCIKKIKCEQCSCLKAPGVTTIETQSAEAVSTTRINRVESLMDQLLNKLNQLAEADVIFNVNQIEPLVVELLKCKAESDSLKKLDQLESLLDELKNLILGDNVIPNPKLINTDVSADLSWEARVTAMLKSLIESKSIDESESNIKKLKVLDVICIDKRSNPSGNLWIVDKGDSRLEAVINELRAQGIKIKPDSKRCRSKATDPYSGWYHRKGL